MIKKYTREYAEGGLAIKHITIYFWYKDKRGVNYYY